jgi:uncharacterized protein DUF6702
VVELAVARAAVLAGVLWVAGAHPMHTAVAELAQEDASGTTSVRIKVFADDFQSAVTLPPDPIESDSATARYLRGVFALSDRTGRPVRLAWAGAERAGDVILLRLRGTVPGGLAGARVTSLVLCERFEDEVNVVRAAYGGRTETLLFTRGEWSKALP